MIKLFLRSHATFGMASHFLYACIIAFFSSFQISYSQGMNAVWIFGDSARMDFNGVNAPIAKTSSMVGRGSSVSVCDSNGSMLFYARTKANILGNSTVVFDNKDSIMQNGDSIVGQAWYQELLAVNFPDSPNQYILFSIGIVSGISQQGFFHSTIQFDTINGISAVVQKNNMLLNNRMGDCLQAMKHGNGRDWWIIAKMSQQGSTTNRFYIYLVTPLGISNPYIQDFGNAHDGDFQKIIFNNAGTKLMNINFIGLMTEYDFDRCTGILSNPKFIFPEQLTNTTRWFWEGAYSPNDSLFYVTVQWKSAPNDTSRILQYNLFSNNIPASCDTLHFIKSPVTLGAIRQAPDNKLYVSNFYYSFFPGFPYPDSVHNIYNENLTVIENPNVDGVGCNLLPYSFYLGGKRCYGGLPNNPNYNMGRWVGSPCDTLLWAGVENPQPTTGVLNTMISLNPNPATNSIFISATNLKSKNVTLQICNSLGAVIFTKSIETNTDGTVTHSIDISELCSGIFFVSLHEEQSTLRTTFIKE